MDRENSSLVNNLANPKKNKGSKGRLPKEAQGAIRALLIWFFGIFLSIGAIFLSALSIHLGGGEVDFWTDVFYKSELIFIGITICVSLILENDTQKIVGSIMAFFYCGFIVIGAFMYSHYISKEYTSIVQALSLKQPVEDAELLYRELSSGGEFCFVFLLIIFVVGLLRHIYKIVKSLRG